MAEAKAERGAKAERPLSPHLQVYRLEINMVMSIIHRITGGALYFGTVIVACVLVAVATGAETYDHVTGLLSTWLGQLILFGYTWALLHHMAGGLRHFIWDTGRGFDLKTIDLLSWATLAFSLTGTLLVWGYALFYAGGVTP